MKKGTARCAESMITRAWQLVLVLMVASGLAGCVSTVHVPMPPSSTIVPPAAGVSATRAAFSGKWTGSWTDRIEHVLVVEEVTETDAIVVYAWGPFDAADPSRSFGAGWMRVPGTFEDDNLVVKLPRPATVTYRLFSDRKLIGKYEWEKGMSWAILTKAPPG